MTRVVYGLLYVGIFIGCLLGGTISTAIFIAVVSWLCCTEFFDMMKRDGKMPSTVLGLPAAALFPVAALGDSYFLSAALFLLVLSVGLWYVFSPRCRIADVSVTLMGPVYTGFMLSSIVLMRDALPGFPGALLSIGASFKGTSAIRRAGPTLAAAFIKTVGLSLVFIPCAVALGFRQQELVALLIMLGSPTTPSAYVMARNMGHEGVLTASAVALTTLLSALTLTGWIFVLRSGGWL